MLATMAAFLGVCIMALVVILFGTMVFLILYDLFAR